MNDRCLPTWPVVALMVGLRAAAGAPVVIDGEFDDWERTVAQVAATTGARPAAESAAALRDPAALYLSIQLQETRNLQSMPATLALVLMAAPGAPGGARYRDLTALRVLEFSPPAAGGARFGARMLTAVDGGWDEQPLAGTGILSAPTHSSTRFEIRIPWQQIPPGAAALAILYPHPEPGPGPRTMIQLDQIPVATKAPATAAPALQRPADAMLRVLVWNVGGEGFERHVTLLANIARRFEVDLLLLDEAPATAGTELAASLPPGWQVVAGTSGGRQRGVLASIHPLRPVPEFEHLAYPEAAMDLVEREGTAFMRRDLRQAAEEGVAAAAAVLEFGGRDWLLVSADLQCCGRDGSVEDRMRRFQAGVIRDALERAWAARPGLAGVLVGGDLNLVGSHTPLDILAGAPDAPGGALRPVAALQLDGLSNHTWGRPGDRFPPARTDFLLHPPALDVVNALVLDAADRDATADLAGALAAASDHLPLIVDFRTRPVETAPRGGGSIRSDDR